MAKILYMIGAVMLVSTGALCTLCGMQWLHGAPQDPRIAECSSVERLRMGESLSNESNREVVSPLVQQATAFALYLKPPEPPVSKETPRPQAPVPPPPRPVATAPKFRLLSTTWHHTRPEKSLALVSEPGRGDRWVRKGDRLGHLVVESIGNGALTYRDGAQMQEMKIAMKQTAELARAKPVTSAAAPGVRPAVRLVNAPQLSQPVRTTAGAPPVARE